MNEEAKETIANACDKLRNHLTVVSGEAAINGNQRIKDAVNRCVEEIKKLEALKKTL